jgi:hypothetical protein
VTPRKLYNFYIDPDLADGLKRLKALDRDSEGAIVVARYGSTSRREAL